MVTSKKVASKKVLFLTGTRADFGKIKSLVLAAQKEPRLETAIFVTGMHMLKRYGLTVNEIRKAGIKNIFTYINQRKNDQASMDVILAHTILGLSAYVEEHRPDLIVVHGDRVETLAGAIVGSLNNILIAHIEGGELSGTIDELIRHSVTKLSHLHFVSNQAAKKRLQKMGELENSIFVIGSPEVDTMLSPNLPTLQETKKRYDIEFKNYSIFCYHPVTTELDQLEKNIKEIIEALINSDRKYVVIYPNNDAGCEHIFSAFKKIKNNDSFLLLPSMRFEHYLTLLKNADFFIGNSSSGVREAPVYGIPSINLGSRQQSRSNSASVTSIDEDKQQIITAIDNIKGRFEPSTQFGSGKSTKQFLHTLSSPEAWATKQQKQFKD